MNNEIKNKNLNHISDTQKIVVQLDNQLLRSIWDNVIDALIMVDEQGIIELFNPAAESLFGYSIEEAKGKNVNMLMPEPFHSSHERHMQDYLITGMSRIIGTRFEVKGMRKDQTVFPIELSLNEVLIGKKRHFVGILLDISERKQTENQLRLQIAALESAANAIVLTDRQGNINWVNPAFCKLTGYALEEAIGENTRLLKSNQHNAEFYKNMWNTIQQGKVWRGEVINRRKNGSFYVEDMTITPVRDDQGEITNYIAIKQDISKRKEIEKIKEEFVSIVSHELRTPLASIRGALGIIVDGFGNAMPPQAKTLIDLAYQDIERLVRLVNSILQVEQLEAGTFNLNIEPIEIMPLISHSIELSKHYGDQFNIRYQIKHHLPNSKVCAEKDSLIQVLVNLLSNAAKFSCPDSSVHVSAKQCHNSIRVEITNYGSPIPPEFHASIFQKFAQADSSNSRKKDGTGLGLYITKSIVNKLNGQIGFTSNTEEGTTFYFELPECTVDKPDCAQCSHHYPAPALLANTANEKIIYNGLSHNNVRSIAVPPLMHILLIEDEPHLQQVVKLALELTGGFSIDICSSGKEALEKAPLLKPDLILMDIMMPEMDGTATYKAMQTIPEIAKIPVIFMTAKSQNQEIENYLKLGAIDVIKKPFDPKTLSANLKNIWINYYKKREMER